MQFKNISKYENLTKTNFGYGYRFIPIKLISFQFLYSNFSIYLSLLIIINALH